MAESALKCKTCGTQIDAQLRICDDGSTPITVCLCWSCFVNAQREAACNQVEISKNLVKVR